MRRALLSVLLAAGLLPPGPASAATVVNGSFESGDLSGWQVHNSSPYGDWTTYAGSSVSGLFPPPTGKWAAVSTEFEPDTMILYQDVALEPYFTHLLKLTVYYHSFGPVAVPNTLATDGSAANNQQLRVDVTRPAAPIESVTPGDVLATLFANRNGDPTMMIPTRLTADLTRFGGQTVRLRIANAVQDAVFNAAVDDAAILSTPPANAFSRGRLVRNKSKGTAILGISVPGQGVLRATDVRTATADGNSGARTGAVRIRAATARPTVAGTVKLRLTPTAAGRRALEARERLRVRLRATFTPTGGTASIRIFSVLLKLTRS